MPDSESSDPGHHLTPAPVPQWQGPVVPAPPGYYPPPIAAAYCYACALPLDPRAAICPRCGVAQRQLQMAQRGHPNAALGLILNFFIPGVGSLTVGATAAGVIQLLMFLVSIPMDFLLIGIPLGLAAWIWGIVTGIQAFSKPPPVPRYPYYP